MSNSKASATISRKEKEATALSKDESERVLGIAPLIGKVQTMVEESGDPTGFDAARWVADWHPLHPDLASITATTIKRWIYDPRVFS